jgi:chemotaxis protein methyltransferase CheR
MTAALTQVSHLVKRESGIVLQPAQLSALEAAIARVEKGMTPERMIAEAGSPNVVQRLIDEVTVRETFFFRHRAELDAIDWHEAMSGALARGSEVVRVWVAGCASGEEAYTVAALACEAYATAAPPIRIVASDIAMPALEQARRGRYGARSTRLLPAAIRERYFVSDGVWAEVTPPLRALVEVVQHNLVRASRPPGGDQPFDVILCRNVLIYFDQPTVERVLARLEQALAPAGTLVLGAADLLSRKPWRVGGAGSPARERRRPVPRPVPGKPALVPSARAQAGAASAAPATPATPQRRLGDALQAADRGDLASALEITRAALARDPLSAEAYYVRGLAELADGDARRATASLRRALYVNPNFSAAAFKLARAHDDLGEVEAARRAYRRTLRTLDAADAGDAAASALLDPIDRGDLALACHARLSATSAPQRRTT